MTTRYLHVSTRYGLRVVSVSPYVTEFVKKEPGITYRRTTPKVKRPGRVRRTRLARERDQAVLMEARARVLSWRNAAKSVIAP